MKVIVLGANGMIGSTMLRILARQAGWQVCLAAVTGRQGWQVPTIR